MIEYFANLHQTHRIEGSSLPTSRDFLVRSAIPAHDSGELSYPTKTRCRTWTFRVLLPTFFTCSRYANAERERCAPRTCELPFAGPVRAEVFHGANPRSVHHRRVLRWLTSLATKGELSTTQPDSLSEDVHSLFHRRPPKRLSSKTLHQRSY